MLTDEERKNDKTKIVMNRLIKRITALILTMAMVCMIGCKKTDDPNNGGNNGNNGGNGGETPEVPAVVSTSEVQYDGIVYIEAVFEDESKMYFALLSPTEAEVVRGELYCQDNPSQAYIYRGEVVIPETITHKGTTYTVVAIGNRAFVCCELVTFVYIPNTVQTIHELAFGKCSNLVKIIMSDNTQYIDQDAFISCDALTEIFLPSTVIRIDNGAFSLWDETTIQDDATSITCMALNPPELGYHAFGYRNIQNIYVPTSSIDAYKTADGWSEYADKIIGI